MRSLFGGAPAGRRVLAVATSAASEAAAAGYLELRKLLDGKLSASRDPQAALLQLP